MSRRHLKRTLAIAFLGLTLLCGIGAYAVGSALMAPSPSLVGDLPEDLVGESVLIPSESGSLLHGWFVPGRHNAVVLLHGLHASRRNQLDRARLVHGAGYSVLLFDFQAHGESSGSNVTFGYLESRDARAAVDYVRRRLPGQKVAVIAQSMGGAGCNPGTAGVVDRCARRRSRLPGSG
jgi:pimeloyl-ACP methyl ester carboxylesterase